MPEAGQKLFCKNFIFADNTSGDKLLIVLNNCKNQDACLVLKTTSKEKNYTGSLPGCNSRKKCFCIFIECEQEFSLDTFVQLEQIYTINIEQLLNTKQLSFIGRLSNTCFTNLKRCLRNFRDDIPIDYWKLIYKPT